MIDMPEDSCELGTKLGQLSSAGLQAVGFVIVNFFRVEKLLAID